MAAAWAVLARCRSRLAWRRADAAAAGRGAGTGAGAPSRSSAAAGGAAPALAAHVRRWRNRDGQLADPFEHDLIKDIVPFVESRYSAYSDPDHRALAGLSMGGGQALNIGLVHPRRLPTLAGSHRPRTPRLRPTRARVRRFPGG